MENDLIPVGIAELVERNSDYSDSAGVSTRMGDLRTVVATSATTATTIQALVEALEAVKPVLAHALRVCDDEGLGPSEEESDRVIAQIDTALAHAHTM